MSKVGKKVYDAVRRGMKAKARDGGPGSGPQKGGGGKKPGFSEKMKNWKSSKKEKDVVEQKIFNHPDATAARVAMNKAPSQSRSAETEHYVNTMNKLRAEHSKK